MLYRPSDLAPAESEAFEAHAVDLRERLLDRVEALVLDLPSDDAGRLVYELAFKPSEALSKREERPKLDTALLAEQVYLEHDPDGADLAAVLEFTAAVQEYFDVLDDVVDGDVTAGREPRAILATQLLLPLVLARVDRFGATARFADRVAELVDAPIRERGDDPTPDAYRDLLDRQATLYGLNAEISAVAAGASDREADRAGRLGRAIYRHRQAVLDYEQYVHETEAGWNAGALFGETELREYLGEQRQRVERLVADFEPDRARLIAGLVALDVEAWRDSLPEQK